MSNTATETNVTKSANTDNTDTEVFSDIVDKYRNADKGDKARIRTNVNKKAMSALSDGNFALATKYANTAKLLTSDKPDVPVDFAQIVSNLTNVVSLLNKAISDITDEAAKQDIKVELDKLPVPTNGDKADKLVKSLMSRKSDRRDIQGVYDRAFDGAEAGTVLVVSEIASKGALDDYTPGSGAVAARLRGDAPQTLTADCTLDGFEPVWVERDGSVIADWTATARVGARKL